MMVARDIRQFPGLRTRPLKYRESPDAWQTKIHMLIGLPFPLPWMLVGCIFFAVGYLIAFLSNEESSLIRVFAVNSVLIAVIANSVVFFEKLLDDVADTYPQLLDEPPERSKEWVERWYRYIFWSNKNIMMEVGLGSLCLMTSLCDKTSVFQSLGGKAYSCFLAFVIGFFGGSMFWAMLGIAGLTASLGRDVQIKPSIFDSSISVLRTASSVLLKVSLTAILVYLFGMWALFLSHTNLNIWTKILPSASGVFVIFYFIFPQRNIHKILANTKRKKLKMLIETIDKTFDHVSSDPTPERINQLRDLFYLQTVVDRKWSWSFGVGELLMLIGSVLLPLLFFVIDHFIG